MKGRFFLLPAAPFVALALTACADRSAPTNNVQGVPAENAQAAPTTDPEAAATASVENAWIRLPAAPGVPGGGYFEARLSRPGDAITGVSSPSAERIEMHETIEENGVSRMVAIERAGSTDGTVRFEPGARHLMLFGLDPALRPQGTIALTFTFAEAPPVTVQATLAAPGDNPGAHHGH